MRFMHTIMYTITIYFRFILRLFSWKYDIFMYKNNLCNYYCALERVIAAHDSLARINGTRRLPTNQQIYDDILTM